MRRFDYHTGESATLNVSGEQDRVETLNKINKYENVDMSLFYTFVHKLNYFQTGGGISLNLVKLSL